MKTKIALKICGMKYPENITAIAALQPDYMGFIFYQKSARYFDGEIPELPETIQKTGVFVDAGLTAIQATIARYGLQAVQLHGQESPELCRALKNQTGVTLIKTFSVDVAFDFRQLEEYETVCDYYLFDTKGQLPGGNGFAFDWTLLEKYPSKKPYFLSGGIDVNAINTILSSGLTPFAIDINSKFETAPGLKSDIRCRQAVTLLKEQLP